MNVNLSCINPELLADLSRVLDRARLAGVDKIMLTSGTPEELQDNLAIIRDYGDVHLSTTVGIHPTRCNLLDGNNDGLAILRSLSERARENAAHIGAFGEMGLDYDRMQYASADCQQRWFHGQFEHLVDGSLDRPLFLHMRNACQDFCQIVRQHRGRFREGVVHSFTGTSLDAQMILSLDLHIGINGCSLKTAENLNVIRETIPLDRIMIESDAPWCEMRPSHAGSQLLASLGRDLQGGQAVVAKEKYRPLEMMPHVRVRSRNEPASTRDVLEVVAALKGIPVEEAASIIYETTCKVFNK